MKKTLLNLLVGAAVMATVAAQAVQINGSIAFSGTPVLTGGNPLWFNTADKIDISAVSVNAGEAVGDYAPASGYVFVAGDVFGPIDINPVVPPAILWSFAMGPTVYTFDSTAVTTASVAPRAISIVGTGTASITGFDDTPGTWVFQANKSGSSFSFSSTADATPQVPDGGVTLMLLGGAMSALALIRRKMA